MTVATTLPRAYHGAEPQAKRSPKARSAVPGTASQVSKVACNWSGRMHHRLGLSDGVAPMSRQDRKGIGANLGDLPGLVVLCLLLKRSPMSKDIEIDVSYRLL